MSQMTAHAARPPFLPPELRDFLRRRALETLGVVVAGLAVAFLIALLSASPRDPSFDTATDGPARNLMGLPGAYAADLALQTLGLASLAATLVGFAWGLRLVRSKRLGHWGLRLVLLPPLLLLAALTLATLPRPESWPFAPGLGGFLGAALRGWAGSGLRLAGTGGETGLIVGAGGAVLTLALLVFVMGLPWSDYQRAGRGIGRSAGFLGRLVAGRCAWLYELWASRRRNRLRIFDVRRIAEYPAERFAEEPDDAEAFAGDEVLDAPEPPAARPREPRPPRVEAKAGPRLVEPRQARTRPGKRASQGQRTLDLLPSTEYVLPPLDFLQEAPSGAGAAQRITEESLEKNARLLESVLADFGVKGQIVKVRPGPVVTLYELEPAAGTRTARVVGLADDVARSMSAVSVRIAVVTERGVIGIELPNRQRETVYLRELLASDAYERTTAKLSLILGKDIGGGPVIVDLARMPHLLIAGTTGSGKSVAINTMILSLIYRLPPDRCKFIMIDPKMLELSVYDGIPHLLSPVVTDPRKAIVALKWTVREMEDRYRAMSKLGVRNIEGYNARIAQARAGGEVLTRRVQTGFDQESGEPIYETEEIELKPLPFIVVVVDEMADLMMVAGKDIEAAIQRLAQMARAAGIHIIMATQRPSVDVITGTIKANFPSRVSFHVTSKIDSRTILGEMGAEQLLGQGDMLYMAHGGRIMRVHGPFVGDAEVEQVVQFLKQQGEPTYIEDVTRDEEDPMAEILGESGGDGSDELYDRAVAVVCRERKASTSFIQRHLQIGYNRAARIMERMEKEGVVGAPNHVGKREVLARNIEERE